jgi:hypothetical protein
VVYLQCREIETTSARIVFSPLQRPTHNAAVVLNARGWIYFDEDGANDTLCRRRSFGEDVNSVQIENKIS